MRILDVGTIWPRSTAWPSRLCIALASRARCRTSSADLGESLHARGLPHLDGSRPAVVPRPKRRWTGRDSRLSAPAGRSRGCMLKRGGRLETQSQHPEARHAQHGAAEGRRLDCQFQASDRSPRDVAPSPARALTAAGYLVHPVSRRRSLRRSCTGHPAAPHPAPGHGVADIGRNPPVLRVAARNRLAVLGPSRGRARRGRTSRAVQHDEPGRADSSTHLGCERDVAEVIHSVSVSWARCRWP